MMIRKDPYKGYIISNLRLVTLLNTELNILADMFYLIPHSLEQMDSKPRDGWVLVRLDNSKTFYRVNNAYFMAFLEAGELLTNFCRWRTAMYSKVKSITKVDGFFSKPVQIDPSICQWCTISSLLYLLEPKPLLRKLDGIGRTPE